MSTPCSANFAALGHFPVLNLPVESQQADDATPSERRSSVDVRHVAQRGELRAFSMNVG
jgi:hypothetical protein